MSIDTPQSFDRDLCQISEKWVWINEKYSLNERSRFLLENTKFDTKISQEDLVCLRERFEKEKTQISQEVAKEWEDFFDQQNSKESPFWERQKYVVQSKDTLWKIVKNNYPQYQTPKEISDAVNMLVSLQPEGICKQRLLQDTHISGGKRGKDGIMGDNIQIWDIIEIPTFQEFSSFLPLKNK